MTVIKWVNLPGHVAGVIALKAEEAERLLEVVNSTDGDQVNVRVPLRLIRTGVKLTTTLPSETNGKLAKKGIDLSEPGKLEGEDLVDALRELAVDVDSANGDTVRVFCEWRREGSTVAPGRSGSATVPPPCVTAAAGS